MNNMQDKINSLEKTVRENTGVIERNESTCKNKLVIKNLKYDESEKDSNQVTINKIHELFKDGLALANIQVESVTRKESKGQYPGVVICEIKSAEDKTRIFKKKNKLKDNRKYSNVYIENDRSVETRNLQASLRTVLKEIGKEKDYKMVALTETFLREHESLEVPGYKFYRNNRKRIHKNAVRGSGGVGVLIKREIVDSYSCEIINSDFEGILWIKLNATDTDFCVYVAVCYLPPAGSSRVIEPDLFFQNLLEGVYSYQNKRNIVICADFNSRVGRNLDYIEGVDNVKPRNVVDFSENHSGDVFINFLCDTNISMFNGRFDDREFTYISPMGKSVVDFMCVPYEDIDNILDFKIIPMSKKISDCNYVPDRIPDHSLLCCDIRQPKFEQNIYSAHDSTDKRKRYKLNSMPDDFLSNNEILDVVNSTILQIENSIRISGNIHHAYDAFTTLIHKEMENRIPVSNGYSKRKKSLYKPYWNDTLNCQWEKVCAAEKSWLKSSISNSRKRTLK
ncbi:unnamed protein product [Mytilus coruscus]|uniref:Endonuclease/exonuclease/phosphatase domain-containing protein n=1 Tax=Mytilus coruscus TaxID=42192 RepID=A0A6J8CWS9_MYTCO|nr:unnamed protein product [Mytilus coruscus]